MAIPSIPVASVSATGITAPDYATILATLQAAFRSIYGSDIDLDADTQDGQLVAIFAQCLYDANQMAVAVYNEFSPATAQGAGLSSVVKINGIAREAASNSSTVVTLVGQAGTQIISGIVGDNLGLGTQWQLPDLVTIPGGGSIDATALSIVQGAVTAAPGTLTQIITPTLGWQTVTNAAAADLGAPVETDAALRQRQAKSTALPAQTILEGIYGTLANVPGVVQLAVYENDTDATDVNSLAPHSISAVVQGGDIAAIAAAIAAKKSPGTGTYGTTSQLVIDANGVPDTINFFELAQVTVSVVVTIRALTGYVSTTGTAIAASVSGFISSSLTIGEDSYLSRLSAPANLSGDAATTATGQTQAQLDALAATYFVLSITQSRSANPAYTTITGGPYTAGATTANVVAAAEIYAGQVIQITLDDASTLTTTVSGVSGLAVSFSPAVPTSRSIVTGANLYLKSDVVIAFNEDAISAATDVTVTVA